MTVALVLLSGDSNAMATAEALMLRGIERGGETARKYRETLKEFRSWCDATKPADLLGILEEYRVWLKTKGASSSTVNLRLSAMRRFFRHAANAGFIDRSTATEILAVKNLSESRVKRGHWLTLGDVKKLLLSPDNAILKGKRDRVILALLIGCGVRREEVVSIEVDHLRKLEDRWVIARLVGKRGRARRVPVPEWVKEAIDDWLSAASIKEGNIIRAIHKSGTVLSREHLSAGSIWNVVLEHASSAGIDRVTPHDLRRTCALLCRKKGGRLEQVMHLLGHQSIHTTWKYLDEEQELGKDQAVNDLIKI